MKGVFELTDKGKTEVTMRLSMSIEKWRFVLAVIEDIRGARSHKFTDALREGIREMLGEIGPGIDEEEVVEMLEAQP